MKVYLAATESIEPILAKIGEGWRDIPMLQSFWYLQKKDSVALPKNVMIDSGAFTFMEAPHKKQVDWAAYIRRYAQFIKKHNIRLFFELDIDAVVGYPKVLELRALLKREAERKPIPVWHKSRGKDDFVALCKSDYEYIAIGGIASGEIMPRDYVHLPWFIDMAHKHGKKIHGLGMTSTTILQKCHFDSVDSSTWIVGSRFANICRFVNKEMKQVHLNFKRCKDVDALQFYNFNQWIKFQRYAEVKL